MREDVDAIFLQFPLPSGIDAQTVADALAPLEWLPVILDAGYYLPGRHGASCGAVFPRTDRPGWVSPPPMGAGRLPRSEARRILQQGPQGRDFVVEGYYLRGRPDLFQ